MVYRDANGKARCLRFTSSTGDLGQIAKAIVDAFPPELSEAVWRAVAGERSEEIGRLRLLLRDYGRVIDDRQEEVLRLRRTLNPVIAEVSG